MNKLNPEQGRGLFAWGRGEGHVASFRWRFSRRVEPFWAGAGQGAVAITPLSFVRPSLQSITNVCPCAFKTIVLAVFCLLCRPSVRAFRRDCGQKAHRIGDGA